MKKILILLVMIFTFSLVSCGETTTQYDYAIDIDNLETDIQNQIDALELQLEILQERLDNLTVIEGLNGQRSYYENQMAELSETIIELSTKFDKDKMPTYTIDENGDYVSFDDLAILLKQKYFGVSSSANDNYMMTYQARMVYKFTTELDANDIYARLVLLIEELRHYEFYIISCSYINVTVLASDINGQPIEQYINIPLVIMLNEAFTVDIETIYNGSFEIEYEHYNTVDLLTAQALYDDYVLNETFTGYVLDY